MKDIDWASFVYFVPSGLSKFKETSFIKVQFVDVRSFTIGSVMYSQLGYYLEQILWVFCVSLLNFVTRVVCKFNWTIKKNKD